MSDPVELILEFLQRHQFAQAEAAFKAELLLRDDRGRHLSPVENASDWNLQLQSRRNLPREDDVVNTKGVQTVVLPLQKEEYTRGSINKDTDSTGISNEEARSPPEKQLYVEYEPGKLGFRDLSSTASQEFAFEEARTSTEHGVSAHLITEDQVTFPVQDSVFQGARCMSSSVKGKGSLPCVRIGNSAELLPVGAWHAYSEPTEQYLVRHCEGMDPQQQLKPSTSSLSNSQHPLVQRQFSRNLSQKECDSNNPGCPSNTFTSTNIQEDLRNSNGVGPPHLDEEKAVEQNLTAGDQLVEASASIDRIDHGGKTYLQEYSICSTSPSAEEFHNDPSLKTFLPICIPKPSQNPEQQSLSMSEMGTVNSGRLVKNLMQDSNGTELILQVAGNGRPLVLPHSNADLDLGAVRESGELPRLPPVKLHSIDKNMDIFKRDVLWAEDEHHSQDFEARILESIEAITAEDTLGWSTLVDCPLGQDVTTSGLKRPLFRPSVSQGIVEALSEQLSAFASVTDGQNQRWYPNDYCDSDTYEDDDDPGYIRQPIEDEEWFLAHEIDYPSDDERARQHMDKNALNSTEQSRKVDEDDRSLGEEHSYFSGEECYRSQAAKKEVNEPQESELRDLSDRHFTSTSMYTPQTGNNLVTLPGVGRDNIGSEALDSFRMRSQRLWRGSECEVSDFDLGLAAYKEDTTAADGIDDDNHDSVRSGGILVSSDVADVGSEVRDSLIGGSSEGDMESLRDQELARYESANENPNSEEFQIIKKQLHNDRRRTSVQHLKDDDEKHDMVLQYYNEAWGLCERAGERELARSAFESKVSSTDLSKKQLTVRNKGVVDNGGSRFEGFSFPSPSSTGDVAVSTAGSGNSLWSNRESTAQEDEIDGYGRGMVGPDDTLAAWRLKSNNSSPMICSSEENLQKLGMPDHSLGSFRSTDDYKCLEAKAHGFENLDPQFPKVSQPLIQEEEHALDCQEDIRTLGADEDQYEIFDLRIIHRKNRTGFEEDKEFPVMINSVIAGRYHVTEYLGSAAFSKAIQAHDLHTGTDVCMKIIKNNKDFFDQSLDEIKLLKFINKHDPVDRYHILRLYDYFYHREHLFIVCELLRANLYEFHKFNRESGGEVYFTMPRLQSITRQCLEALEFLHRLGVIHCDLKPENILVKSYSRCEIKIIDLGSSCFQTDHLCSYVQSRSYRAPEVILGLPYDQKIDIWSLGCILAELCTGNVLFQNDSLATLLARVEGILGPIDSEVLAKGRDTYKYFTKNHVLYEKNQETDQLEYLLPKRTSLTHRLPMGDQGFVEFVRYLLQSNPTKRPIATEALSHPWLSYPYEPISS